MNSMQGVTIDSIITNYKLLGDADAQIRDRANLYLMGLIDHQEIWKITEEMILHSQNPDYQLLGAQLLYQKVERDIDQLQINERIELKGFIFGQLVNQKLALPTIRKIASSAALVAVSLILDHWPSFLTDILSFMEASPLQLRNGLIVLQRLPEQLKNSNRIKHGHKMLIRQKLIEQSDLLSRVYSSAILLNQETLITICLDGIQNWILVGFPLQRYTEMVNMLLGLMKSSDMYLQNCCKIIKEGLTQASREKNQSLSDSEFNMQKQRYSKEQIESLKAILQFLQRSKPAIYLAIEQDCNSEQIEIYTSIIKEILLSYGFLLNEAIGYQLIEMMFKVFSSTDLKLSYSTFQFWIDFCQKLSKLKVQAALAQKFWQIVEHLFDSLVAKTSIDKDTLLNEMLKDEETIDDLTKLNIAEYRKEAQYLIKFVFDYFSSKRQQEGSLLFFRKILSIVELQKSRGNLIVGLEQSIYLIKAALQSMVREYDTSNIVDFIQYIMNEVETFQDLPPRLTAEVLNLIKDCNREVKEADNLFVRCLSFCLKQVADDNVSHYAVYAFQSLMESINELNNDVLVNDLMNFYTSMHFTKETVLQKVLEGILTTITKLTNTQAMEHYLKRIVAGVESKYAQLEGGLDSSNSYVSLIEIKTLLDSFDHFRASEQQYFRQVFLKISSVGIAITTNIIEGYLTTRKKFTTVGDLGASMRVIKNSLRVCEHSKISQIPMQQYLNLMNMIMGIFTPQNNMFNEYCGLTDIIIKVFTQFVGQKVPILDTWLATALPIINAFFLAQISRYTITTVDPDLLRWYFSIAEAVLIFNKDIYLAQPDHFKTYDLAVHSVEYINERVLQRKAINLVYQCVQLRDVYEVKTEQSIKAIFASIPHINGICHSNLGRILVILLEKIDLKAKENVIRQLLEYQPFTAVSKDIKEVMAKLMAFAIDSKVDRYIKGAITDLTDVRWKQTGSDQALHLELRYTKWKKEYSQSIKTGNIPK